MMALDNRKCKTNYDVRLVGGNDTSEGIVEICYGGVWNSFCSPYGFDNRLAATICYQLGYRKSKCMNYYFFNAILFSIFYVVASASIFKDGRFGRAFNIQYLTYNYYCSSPYQQLQRCSLSQRNCGIRCSSSYNHIGLKCHGEIQLIFDDLVYYSKTNSYHLSLTFIEPGNCNEGDVRLVNGSIEREGRLEVCAQGLWGAICPGFSKSSAYIACKQLGYDDTNGNHNISSCDNII